MWFLFFQIWLWLLVAFIAGWFAHWFFRARNRDTNTDKSQADKATAMPLTLQQTSVESSEKDNEALLIDATWKPVMISDRPSEIDDLKLIKGIGEVLEKTLNDLGVYRFRQIAEWSDENVAWVNNFLSFTGRIDRENWREQAKQLAATAKDD